MIGDAFASEDTEWKVKEQEACSRWLVSRELWENSL